MSLILCCRPANDLCRVLDAGRRQFTRFDTPAEAVAAAPAGAGVLLLADGYPSESTPVDAGVYEAATEKGLRLYVEYPSSLPEIAVGEARATTWERGVVASSFFGAKCQGKGEILRCAQDDATGAQDDATGAQDDAAGAQDDRLEELRPLRILAIHDCRFLPVEAADPHLVVARVAGFDTAVYGLPEQVWPILFEHPRGGILVATTKLSQFLTARYAPTEAWRSIWRAILAWVAPDEGLPELQWQASVRPTYAAGSRLSKSAEAEALRRGTEWFQRSRLLVHPLREAEIAEQLALGHEDGPTPPPEAPAGDGSRGILEGYSAQIRFDGSQQQRLIHRSDCNGESAMGLAFGGHAADVPDALAAAGRILDYWYFDSIAQKGTRADPAHPAFGLVAWGTANWAWEKAFYGDDNARLLLGTMSAAALAGTGRWDEPMLRCLLGNLRTTGRLGFRLNRIDLPELEANGWQHYFDEGPTSYAPHYQAYLWACYLWAYRQTGLSLFLERAECAIRMTMEAYPEGWRWTNGIAQERARMLLPLAWLVRVQDTPEHREWLRRMARDLLRLQMPCGAIREELGREGQGSYGPPRSNEAFGTNEATLMQENGDPLCDLLYTTNFAFIGLHEAAAAAGDACYARAADRLAQFLCRIQVRSEEHPELDGAWFRAFDTKRWEYWASNADAGWGAWSIETGWTQGWITAVLGLRRMHTSLWDLTAASRMGEHLPGLLPLFLPEELC